MPIYPTYNPRLSKADLQERLDIQEGRKIANPALDAREMQASTQVCGELKFIKTPPSPRPNIK